MVINIKCRIIPHSHGTRHHKNHDLGSSCGSGGPSNVFAIPQGSYGRTVQGGDQKELVAFFFSSIALGYLEWYLEYFSHFVRMMFYFQSICPCSKEILYIDTRKNVYIYLYLECFFLKANKFAAKRHLKLETDNLTLHLTFLWILTKGMLLMGKMIIPSLRCKCPPFVVEQSSSPKYLGYLTLFVTCHEFPLSIRYYHKQLS